jgi:hypothetical protein
MDLLLKLTVGLCLSVTALPTVAGFSTVVNRQMSSLAFSTTKLHFEPVVSTIGIALVSAAAGAASQSPKIQQLERELETAKEALASSELEIVETISQLEDKLFRMDEEFEGQTARFQKQYDQQKQEELKRITAKLKVDMQYRLEIKVEEEKSRLLSKELSRMDGSEKQAELATLRLQQSQVLNSKLKVEKALMESEAELLRMQQAAQKTKKFFGLF